MALRSAVGSASDGYSLLSDEVATVSKEDSIEGRLPRGTICAAIPEQMAVPEQGSGKISPDKHSSAIRFFYEKSKERMLRTSAEVPWDEYRILLRGRPQAMVQEADRRAKDEQDGRKDRRADGRTNGRISNN